MNAKLAAIGVFAFVVGFVFFINLGNIFPSGAYPPGGGYLLSVILFEFIMTMCIFGGGILLLRESNIHASLGLVAIIIIVIIVIFFFIFSLGTFSGSTL